MANIPGSITSEATAREGTGGGLSRGTTKAKESKSTGVRRRVQKSADGKADRFPLLLSDLPEEDQERFRRFRDGSVDDMVRTIIKEAVRMILCCGACMVLYAIVRTPLPSRHCHRLPEIYSYAIVDFLCSGAPGVVSLLSQTFLLRPGVGWSNREDSKFFVILGGSLLVQGGLVLVCAVHFINYDIGMNVLFLNGLVHYLIITWVLIRRGNHCPEPKQLHSGLSVEVRGNRDSDQRQARSDRFRRENRAAVFAWLRACLWWLLMLFFIPLTYAEAFPALIEQLADAFGGDSTCWTANCWLLFLAQCGLVVVFFSIVIPAGGHLFANKIKKCVHLYDVDGEDTNLINPVHDDRAMLCVNLSIDLTRFVLGRGILFSLNGYRILFAIIFKDFCYHAWHFGIKHSERWGGNGLIFCWHKNPLPHGRKFHNASDLENLGCELPKIVRLWCAIKK